ncbi:uncharacterized protein K02A2.6-like [Macrosteles quadrilineatus]|uniref:uncharacterized protein K02A2.6-like n=1 Tax=Macrosteles quadrilineatus TaxID=74068 RepID=UPI0023E18FBD|nr:uncharacterized protein K02A2.6-like [Macrosteles quadrilineatus]
MDGQELNNLKKARAVVKGQLKKAERFQSQGSLTVTEVSVKLKAFADQWERYNSIQDQIDTLTDEENLHHEIECRYAVHRICTDYKVTLNRVIKDENHPIPRIEEIHSQMNGGKVFCTLDISNAYLHMKMDEDSAHMQTLSTHKAHDKDLQPILHALEEGKSVEAFGYHDNELTLQDGCIFKGCRVLIPQSLRRKVLDELHIGHLGMEKMKSLARSYCAWKNIDRDIEQLAKSCKQCRLKQNEPRKEQNHPWLAPQGPWERLHIDFAGPMQGQWYFIIVDAFTKWIEVIPTKNTSTEFCTRELRKLFATFGLPMILVSDNGSQFTSSVFEQFLSENGVLHKTTAPYHPSSNGQAERYVQTVKKSLRAMEDEGGRLDVKLFRMLMQLRQTSNSSGCDAYSLMFGRKIRTHIALLHPTRKQETEHVKQATRYFKEGDRVQARNYSNSKDKWSFGRILERESNLLYKVQMDDGTVWRRHVDQLLKCEITLPKHFRGEN